MYNDECAQTCTAKSSRQFSRLSVSWQGMTCVCTVIWLSSEFMTGYSLLVTVAGTFSLRLFQDRGIFLYILTYLGNISSYFFPLIDVKFVW